MDKESRVFRVIEEQLGCEREDISLESTLDQLGADSLDKIELQIALEDEFDIEIPDAVAENVQTVQELVDIVKERC